MLEGRTFLSESAYDEYVRTIPIRCPTKGNARRCLCVMERTSTPDLRQHVRRMFHG